MLRPVMPLANYIINQDYIAEFLCINKDKPKLECNGKCYLTKQLKEVADEKKKNLPPIEMEEYPIGFVLLASFTFPSVRLLKKSLYHYNNRYSFSYLNQIFHPPNITFHYSV